VRLFWAVLALTGCVNKAVVTQPAVVFVPEADQSCSTPTLGPLAPPKPRTIDSLVAWGLAERKANTSNAEALKACNERREDLLHRLIGRIQSAGERLSTVEADAAVTLARQDRAVRDFSGSAHEISAAVTEISATSEKLLQATSDVTQAAREAARVADDAIIGPYARLRPGADIGQAAHIGNFVEVKAVRVGPGAKANHLSYLGDGTVGAGANIGAGTIFCNYDGFDKHRTEVGAGAFIGSNSALVAPVTIGAGAYVGSGSVITRPVSADALAVTRPEQLEKPGWAARFRSLKAGRKTR
jgi:bifunctional N-acetylglucosamine-1-phosphate-uridyltransferase/glucosamine-1-phosphate-acetyltransferase GlmU-like protein